jgi:hypothetical protein
MVKNKENCEISVFHAASMEFRFFLNVAPCGPSKLTDVSEMRTAMNRPDDGSSTRL